MSKSAAAAPEPSMEDILASIRKIITDDEPAKTPEAGTEVSEAPEVDEMAAAMNEMAASEVPEIDEMAAAMEAEAQLPEPEVQSMPQEQADDDVFELTGDMASETVEEVAVEDIPEQAPAQVMQFDEDEDIVFVDEDSEAAPAAPAMIQEDVPVFVAPQPAPVMREMNIEPAMPAAPLISQDATQAVGTQFSALSNLIFSQNARTLDDVVQDMMKPLLKTWLDQNLPGLVERLVREEIERVTRGRR